MSDFFATMYGLLHGAQGPLFIDQIYPQSGAALMVWTGLAVAVFYYIFGWFTATLNMCRHWFVTLGVNSVVCMLTVLAVCRFATGALDVDGPTVTLALIQGLYAALLFAAGSCLFKWFSPHARRTPF